MRKTPRKLIEIALPLDAINAAAAREKAFTRPRSFLPFPILTSG